MTKLKSQLWTNEKGKRFVILPEEDFLRMSELIEDRGLSRIFKTAIATDTAEASIPFAEVKRQLAAQRRAKTRNCNAADEADFRAIEKSKKKRANSPATDKFKK